MNNINQMIAQGVRMPQIESPLNQFAQIEQIRGSQQANQLRQVQMAEMQRQQEQAEALNQLYRQSFDPATGRIDESKLFGGMAQGGFGSQILSTQEQFAKRRKAELDTEKVGSEIETARFNLFEKRMKFYAKEATELKSPLEGQEWYKQLYADPVVKQDYDRRGITLDQLIAQVPTDPAQFEQWKQRTALGADEFIKQNKPQFMQQDTGGATRVLAVPGLGGPATTVGGTQRAKTMTPEAAERERRERDLALAENMAAAKARGTELSKSKVEAERALPGAIETAAQMLKNIDEMIGDAKISKDGKEWEVPKGKRAPAPGFESYVGMTFLPFQRFAEGSDAASYERRQLQVEGRAFLEAFESLKGGGAITEIEGAKATQAISRMNKSQSEVEYIKAARELQEVVRKGVDRARAKAGAGGARSAPAAPGAPAAGAMNPATMSDDELRRALGL